VLRRRQAQRSVLAGYAGQSEYHNQGERVVTGQHLMQAVSDIFFGWRPDRRPNPDANAVPRANDAGTPGLMARR
jgi:hypothetical protein